MESMLQDQFQDIMSWHRGLTLMHAGISHFIVQCRNAQCRLLDGVRFAFTKNRPVGFLGFPITR